MLLSYLTIQAQEAKPYKNEFVKGAVIGIAGNGLTITWLALNGGLNPNPAFEQKTPQITRVGLCIAGAFLTTMGVTITIQAACDARKYHRRLDVGMIGDGVGIKYNF